MTHSYFAFVDESGDDGIGNFRTPGGRGGASRWLVVSCCIYRASRAADAVQWRDEIRSVCATKSPGRTIHFAELNHSQKRVACQLIAKRPVRFISVLTRKDVPAAARFIEKNLLYFYLTRYLIERVSWFAKDYRPQVREGDGRVRITFSRRGGMSYEGFRGYLNRLKSSEDTSINWPVIDIDGIRAESHSANASLQLADIGASAVASAVEADRFGNVEGQYLEELAACIYNRNNNLTSYGLKFLPSVEGAQLSAQQLACFQRFVK